MSVWLLTIGDGSDGDETRVEAVFSSKEKAEAHLKLMGLEKEYRQVYPRVNVDEWAIDPE